MSTAKELQLPEAFKRVLPADVRNADQYFGSFVRIDCESGQGAAFTVRVYLTDWVFFDGKSALADSSGSADRNNELLARLNGARLMSVVAEESMLWLIFSDSKSFKLTANLNEYEIDDELLVATLDEAYLKFSPAKGFTVAPAIRTQH